MFHFDDLHREALHGDVWSAMLIAPGAAPWLPSVTAGRGGRGRHARIRACAVRCVLEQVHASPRRRPHTVVGGRTVTDFAGDQDMTVLVRPYALTGGRTRPQVDIAIE